MDRPYQKKYTEKQLRWMIGNESALANFCRPWNPAYAEECDKWVEELRSQLDALPPTPTATATDEGDV